MRVCFLLAPFGRLFSINHLGIACGRFSYGVKVLSYRTLLINAFSRRATNFDETLRRQSFLWCPGRDLNPGRGLERPACLTGLHHRGSILGKGERLKIFRRSVNPHQDTSDYYQGHPNPPEGMNLLLEVGGRKDHCHHVGEVQERVHEARGKFGEGEQPENG